MAALRAAIFAALWLWAAPALANPLDRWSGHVAEASARFGLPAEWIERVMRDESGGRTQLHGRPIVSGAGAMGLMQLMPGTWAEMRLRLGLGADPHDPRDNILAGTFYLRLMHDRFGYPGLFAAYHAGPARYARHLATGRPLPRATTVYLAAVTAGEPVSRPGALEQPQESLFALRAGHDPGKRSAAAFARRRAAGLFVPLGADGAR